MEYLINSKNKKIKSILNKYEEDKNDNKFVIYIGINKVEDSSTNIDNDTTNIFVSNLEEFKKIKISFDDISFIVSDIDTASNYEKKYQEKSLVIIDKSFSIDKITTNSYLKYYNLLSQCRGIFINSEEVSKKIENIFDINQSKVNNVQKYIPNNLGYIKKQMKLKDIELLENEKERLLEKLELNEINYLFKINKEYLTLDKNMKWLASQVAEIYNESAELVEFRRTHELKCK